MAKPKLDKFQKALGTPIKPPHDFAVEREDWEVAVFRNATLFTTIRYAAHRRGVRKEFGDFPAALADAREDTQGKPALIYAATDLGRFVLVPPQEYESALALWQADHPGVVQ